VDVREGGSSRSMLRRTSMILNDALYANAISV
jgi:hypothetical protein